MNITFTLIPYVPSTKERKVEKVKRDPYWRKRRQHSTFPDKRKQENKTKCRGSYVCNSSD